MAKPTPERDARQRIDSQLARAGWGKGSLAYIEEFLIKNFEINDPTTPFVAASDEFADYALPDSGRRPLAIVEAKKSSLDPIVGERQAADYADRIKAIHGVDPFIFLANGNEIMFWRRSALTLSSATSQRLLQPGRLGANCVLGSFPRAALQRHR
jgi:type I restriction enzyme R subunit